LESKEQPASPCILAVRLRGTVGDSPDVEKTLDSLMLRKTFQARLLKGTPSTGGMLRRVKSLVAWGEIDPQTLGSLLAKRGEGETRLMVLDQEFVKRRFGKDGFPDLAQSIVTGSVGLEELWRAGLKPFFRLHPPRGGFKRSTRRAFADGGELGYRGSEINPLVRRMI
jgi:large subunit ribosomal protein L30